MYLQSHIASSGEFYYNGNYMNHKKMVYKNKETLKGMYEVYRH